MSKESLEQFREVVLKYTTLQERLKATANTESFIKLAVKIGEESGYSFTPEEVEAALQAQVRSVAESPTIEDVVARFKEDSGLLRGY